MTEPAIDGTAEEVGTDLVPTAPPPGLFKTDDPVEVIQEATRVAGALKDVVKAQGLIANIKGKEHPKVEAWQTLGAMLGVGAVPVGEPKEIAWPQLSPPGLENLRKRGLAFGFSASYTATKAGVTVGGGSARCMRTESSWKDRDDYALASMAQTRAISKALSGPLRFVMALAGYETTPAEEMVGERQPPPEPTREQTRTATEPIPDTDQPSGHVTAEHKRRIAEANPRPLTKEEREKILDRIEEWGWNVTLVGTALGVPSPEDWTNVDAFRIRDLLTEAEPPKDAA